MNWKLYLLEWLTGVADKALDQRTDQLLAAERRYGEGSAHARRVRVRQERAGRSRDRIAAALKRLREQRGEPK